MKRSKRTNPSKAFERRAPESMRSAQTQGGTALPVPDSMSYPNHIIANPNLGPGVGINPNQIENPDG